MNDTNNEEKVRVVCYIPLRTNQIFQAHASLEGITKQDLLGDILQQHAETLDIAAFKKEKIAEDKPKSKKKKRAASRKTAKQTISDKIASDIEG